MDEVRNNAYVVGGFEAHFVAPFRYKDVDLGDGKTANKLVEHYGTRAELVDYIREKATQWSYHRWVKDWMKWQSKVNIATFDGRTEILVLTDYAAVYEMKGKTSRTCEHGTTCNQLVALVLHSPSVTLPGEERKVAQVGDLRGFVGAFGSVRAARGGVDLIESASAELPNAVCAPAATYLVVP